MNRSVLLPSAYLLDHIAGDPEWFPHPVRLMGTAISNGERWLRAPDQSTTFELLSGAALAVAVVGSSYLLTSVTAALEAGDLVRARTQLARIVGRDTETLDSHGISRAVIETVAESASDGIIAPLFYMALGGVPLAMAYKAVNTLDSMIGHADSRYFYFGKTAARLDDAANFLPSRISALAIAAAATPLRDADPQAAWRTWLRDGSKHKSPNAGQPEAAVAGALQVALGGDNTYAGERISTPRMGEEFSPPAVPHAKRAIRLVSVASLIGLGVGMALTAIIRARRRN